MITVSDSCVLTYGKPSRLQYEKIIKGSLEAFRLDTETLERTFYAEGKDFLVDYEKGLVYLCEKSAIMDFRTSVFYGVNPFDHETVKEFGNDAYTVYFIYAAETQKSIGSVSENISFCNGNLHALSGFLKEFKGDKLRLAVFGDSISTGCEAFPYEAAYFSLFKQKIENICGKETELKNMSVGGDDTAAAKKRFLKDVMPYKSDLTIIAFGMNDQNKFGDVVPVTPEIYENNLRFFAEELIKRGDKILFVSPCECHKNWIHRSGRIKEYVEVLKKLSLEYGAAFADVNALWNYALLRKSDDDLLRNGINHPNNYGHYLYYTLLKTLL